MSEGRREAGILLPLFSVRGRRDWGIGEIADLAPLVRWLAAAGHGLLQLLPIVETAPGERSPYTVLSAFAIDSIYLARREAEDGVGARAPRPGADGRGGGRAPGRTAPPLPRVRAVGRRRAVERRTTGSNRGGRAPEGRSPVHGRGGQRRRMGPAGRVRSRLQRRCAARRLQR